MKNIDLDRAKLDMLVAHLKKLSIPSDHEDPYPFELSKEHLAVVFLIAVAICHQTTPVHGVALKGEIKGTSRRGWDYLLTAFLIAIHDRPELFEPKRLSVFSLADLDWILQGQPIKNPEVRIALIQNIGIVILDRGWGHIKELFDESGGYLEGNGIPGLYELLALFEAYADPVRKKSSYFLALMRNNNIWTYQDLKNLDPPVNYHESRLHIRIGGVVVNNPDLLERLYEGGKITEDEDQELRTVVKKAIIYTAHALGKTPTEMHYFFWNLARNCCTREKPHCQSCGSTCTLPERYQIGLSKKQRCLFTEVCTMKNQKRMPLDPFLDDTIWH